MKISKSILFASAMLAMAAWLCLGNHAIAKPKLPPLKPVPMIDLQKYAGDWYEIAFVPYLFEKKGQRDATTKYTPTGPLTFQDSFKAILPNGKIKTFTGSLRSKAAGTGGQPDGQFRSTFVKLINWHYWLGVDYWVTGLGKDYDFAIVSVPNRKLNWIFSRTPQLSAEQLQEISGILKNQQIDACKMLVIPQSNGLQQEQPFCKLLESSNISSD